MPCRKTRHMTHRSLRSVHLYFCTAHPFTQPPKSYVLQCFSIGQTPQKVPLPFTPQYITRSLDPPTQKTKLHLDWFSRFALLMADSPYTSQCALKCD